MTSLVNSLVLVLWWIGIWGLVELLVHHIAKNDPLKRAIFYVGLIVLVAGSVTINPDLLNQL